MLMVCMEVVGLLIVLIEEGQVRSAGGYYVFLRSKRLKMVDLVVRLGYGKSD